MIPHSPLSSSIGRYDRDNDGSIDEEELRAMLVSGWGEAAATPAKVGLLLGKVDADGDGKINLLEWLQIAAP